MNDIYNIYNTSTMVGGANNLALSELHYFPAMIQSIPDDSWRAFSCHPEQRHPELDSGSPGLRVKPAMTMVRSAMTSENHQKNINDSKAYMAKGECKILGIMQDCGEEKCHRLADALMHYYKADDIPLGLVENGKLHPFVCTPYYEIADLVNSDNTLIFPPTDIPLSQRLSGVKLYRKLLSEAADGSVNIVSLGVLTILGQLMDSEADEYSSLSGMELIQRKVKAVDISGGCFSAVPLRYADTNGNAQFLDVEYNVGGDIPLAKKVIELWPTPLHLYPLEAGMSFPSVHDKVLEQYSWQPESPIYQTYSRYNEWERGDVGQYLWDAVTTFHCILGEEYFTCSGPCAVRVDEEGHTTLVASDKADSTDRTDRHIIGNGNSCYVSFIWDKLENISAYRP